MYQLDDSLATRTTATPTSPSYDLGAALGGYSRLSRVGTTNVILRLGYAVFGTALYRRPFLEGSNDGWTAPISGPAAGIQPERSQISGARQAVSNASTPIVFNIGSGTVFAGRAFTDASFTNMGSRSASFGYGLDAIVSPSGDSHSIVAYGRGAASRVEVMRVNGSTLTQAGVSLPESTNAAYPDLFPLSATEFGMLTRASDGSVRLSVVDAGTLSCVPGAACGTNIGLSAPLPGGAAEGDILNETLFEGVAWNGYILVALTTGTDGVLAALDRTGVIRWSDNVGFAPSEVGTAVSGTGQFALGVRSTSLVQHMELVCSM